MLLKIFIFIYVFSQIIFYDSITIIPKITGSCLAFLVLLKMFKRPDSINFKWPLIVLLVLIGQAFFNFAFNPIPGTEKSIMSFILISVLLIFFYQGLIISNGFRTALTAFCSGIFINYILIIFFSERFNFKLEWGRVFGTLGNPNYFAFMCNIGFIFFLWLKQTAKKKWSRWIIPFAIVLTAVNVVWSGSKTNILIFSCICFFLFFSVQGNFSHKSFFKGILLTFLSVAGIIAFSNSSFIFMILPEDDVVWKRLDYIGAFFKGDAALDSSDNLRMDMMIYGWEKWVDFPVFGHGFDSYTYLSGFGTYSHSNFIEILFNAGLFGFIFFYSIYFYFFNQFKNKMQNSYISIFVAISLLLIFSFMELSIVFFDDKLIWIVILTITSALSVRFNSLKPITN